MDKFSFVEKSAQNSANLTLEQLKSFSPNKLHVHLSKLKNKIISFISEFPYIGRGNALREELIDTETLNNEIDKILKLDKNKV